MIACYAKMVVDSSMMNIGRPVKFGNLKIRFVYCAALR